MYVYVSTYISLYCLLHVNPYIDLSMQDAMNELAPGNKIVMKRSEDGSGRGAAIVAAVACRLQAGQ